MLMAKELYYEAIDLPPPRGTTWRRRHYDLGIEARGELWGIPVVSSRSRTRSSTTRSTDPTIGRRSALHLRAADYLGVFFLSRSDAVTSSRKPTLIDVLELRGLRAIGIGNTLAFNASELPAVVLSTC